MTAALEPCRFHVRHAWFNVREPFSDLRAALASNALIPFFVWLLSRIWHRFNSTHAHLTMAEIVIYIGLTETLYMTFLRQNSISRAAGDFSIALARPRSWLVTSFSGLLGRSIGSRIFMIAILIVAFPLLGADWQAVPLSVLRFFALMPWLGLLQGLLALFISIAQVQWHQTEYFMMTIGKIFLILGGVLGPVGDFSEPWRTWLLRLPPSDLFFQPAYYCVKGEFYGLTPAEWFTRTGLLALGLIIANVVFFRFAKRHHQSYGG